MQSPISKQRLLFTISSLLLLILPMQGFAEAPHPGDKGGGLLVSIIILVPYYLISPFVVLGVAAPLIRNFVLCFKYMVIFLICNTVAVLAVFYIVYNIVPSGYVLLLPILAIILSIKIYRAKYC